MKRFPSSALKVAAFSVVTVLVVWFMATMIGNVSYSPSTTFKARFTDATSLNTGDPVRLAGVEVGSVQSLDLVSDGENRVAEVTFSVDRSVPVYASAQVQLRYQNLVGGRYIALEERPGDGATMPSGGTFDLKHTKPALSLTQLFNGFQPLFAALQPQQVNDLSMQIIQTLQGEGGTIQQLMTNTAQLTNTIAEKDGVIGQVVDNLTAVLTTVDQRDGSLTALISQFRDLMTGLAQNKDTLGSSLPDLASLLNSSSSMLSAIRPPLRGDIDGLRSFAGQVASTKDTLDQVLQVVPERINTYTRIGHYGSWFNFYLCGADAEFSLLGQSMELKTPAGVQADEKDTVCGGGQLARGGGR
ncbi:MCE family protein [Amycolatopsis sp. K13G38]|uniref:MCE family protein n=1 Tax=Amycolatopsis acididurans TaxID=2724524 RepID=A0ABX1JE76_9PSEU|nr:MCE family protein [Amycolatopsis acididurans]NKQ57754.1 MCE family protein [Amycolatopsis acididurans]